MSSAPLPLIDIGANLTHASFASDLDAVLERAAAHGVCQLVVTGASESESRAALALAQRHPGVLHATAGVHPHHAASYSAAVEASLRELSAHTEVRAIGEAGLDYFRDLAPRAAQLAAFEKQLALAIELHKPVFLHQRDAHEDFLALLKTARDDLPAVVVHCFTDRRRALFDYLDLDCHIGITGWVCDERRGLHLRELVGEIPANRLMLETDAPYLLPRDLKPGPANRRNEPMYLAHICTVIAQLRGEEPATTAANSTRTARAFFALPTLP